MISILIADDEPLARMLIREYLSEYRDITILDDAEDGLDALKKIKLLKPNVVFLDVRMPLLNGFEMLELLDDPPAVIFTTAYDEYAIAAFDANALDYLLKPFSKERLHKALDKINLRGSGTEMPAKTYLSDKIILRDGDGIRFLPLNDLKYIQAYGDHCILYFDGGKANRSKTLSAYEEELASKGFQRIHRSYLVNITFIKRLEPYTKNDYVAILADGSRLPVSRTAFAHLKTILSF